MSALEYLSENRMPVYAGITGILLASILAYILLHSSKPERVRPPPSVTMVVIQPPKPPPPPPPLPQPKTIVQPKMTTPVQKPVIPNQPPKAAPPKPASAAPALGTSLKSNGTSNAFDLSGSGSGNGIIGGSGTGGGGSSYGDAVSYQIQQALQKNPVTRHAAAGLIVQIWVDSSGLISRVELEKSSGDPVMDDAIQNKVLSHLQLYAPPPGTRMPIEMSLTGEAQ
jgi:outer membrane biosynthesis protein TonB